MKYKITEIEEHEIGSIIDWIIGINEKLNAYVWFSKSQTVVIMAYNYKIFESNVIRLLKQIDDDIEYRKAKNTYY